MRTKSNQGMNVIRPAINLKHLMLVILEDACNVLMQTFFPGCMNQSLPEFYSKYELNMNLYVGIGREQ
jgi:hypothetical protein